MSKKRNKKYNPAKGSVVCSERLLRGICVVGIRGKSAYSLRESNYSSVTLTPVMHNALVMIRRNWTSLLYVACRTQFGEEYIKFVELGFDTHHYSQQQIQPVIDQHLDDLISGINKDHYLQSGWVVSAESREFDEDHIGNMLASLGIFEIERHQVETFGTEK